MGWDGEGDVWKSGGIGSLGKDKKVEIMWCKTLAVEMTWPFFLLPFPTLLSADVFNSMPLLSQKFHT
jgi:hypothetical protein